MGSLTPPGASGAPAVSLVVMRKRAEFLAAARGSRVPAGSVMLQARRRDDDPAIRVGFTCSKKVGNAVTRNRMKRRFRALARAVIPARGIAGADHVMIGRPGGNDIAFAELGEHLDSALQRAARKLAK